MGAEKHMDLQTKLTSLRKQKRLTQLDLAEKLNVSRQAISRWEVGAAVPSTDNLKVLSELYEVSVDYLLNDDNDDPTVRESWKTAEQRAEPKGKNSAVAWICAAVLAVALLTALCVLVMHDKENDQIIPIEDMETIIEDDYPMVTFSIG